MADEFGPFDSEHETWLTAAARSANEAFDADPGPGKAHPHRLRILTDACEAAGVELGDLDRQVLEWLANWEIFQAVSVAGMIRRAFEAGKRAGLPEGAVTEWGVQVRDANGGLSNISELGRGDPGERAARDLTGLDRAGRMWTAMHRQVTPWKEESGDERA